MNLKSGIRKALRPIADPLARKWLNRSVSYSGAGEDRIALAWLEIIYGMNVKDIRYCDIGANHPSDLNNTFLLYELGARGVLVEPDLDLCQKLRSVRPRDTVINAGVAFDERRSAKLSRMTSKVFNTFSTAQVTHVLDISKTWAATQRQDLVDEIETPLVPANDILAEHFADGIDFISIDAEGVDLAILQSIDLQRFRPKIICIEAVGDIPAVLNAAGYEQIARTPDNFVFRRL